MSGADSFGMGHTFTLTVLVVAGYILCPTFNRHAAEPQEGS
jgi:hypothetical protein